MREKDFNPNGWIFPMFFKAVISRDKNFDISMRLHCLLFGCGLLFVEPVLRLCKKMGVE
jgi:hypothetical protein